MAGMSGCSLIKAEMPVGDRLHIVKVVEVLHLKVRTLTVSSCLSTAIGNRLSGPVVFAVSEVFMQVKWNVLLLRHFTVLPTESHFGNRFLGTGGDIL